MKKQDNHINMLNEPIKKTGFEVPPGYFESIIPAVQERISRLEQRKTFAPFRFSLRLSTVIAVVALVFVSITVYLFIQPDITDKQLTSSDVMEYISIEMSETSLYDELPEQALEQKNDTSLEELKNYIDNNMDYLSILDEY